MVFLILRKKKKKKSAYLILLGGRNVCSVSTALGLVAQPVCAMQKMTLKGCT